MIFHFQGYGTLSIMGYSDTVFNILLTFRDIEIYGDICHFIRDTCLFKGYEIFGLFLFYQTHVAF